MYSTRLPGRPCLSKAANGTNIQVSRFNCRNSFLFPACRSFQRKNHNTPSCDDGASNTGDIQNVIRRAHACLKTTAQVLGAASIAVMLSVNPAFAELPKYAELSANPDPDLFTDDAWLGMQRLREYNKYIDKEISAREDEPGCEACAAHRAVFERAWQTVANEFYDPAGRFSQAWWAGQLKEQLQASGGVIRDDKALEAALDQLLKRLGDKYTAYLTPAEFRRALRRPLPAERDYYQALFVGAGLQLASVPSAPPLYGDGDGATSPPTLTTASADAPQASTSLAMPLRGRRVEAPLAGSPAESAGLKRDDIVLTIDGVPVETLSDQELSALLRGPVGSAMSVTWIPATPSGSAVQPDLSNMIPGNAGATSPERSSSKAGFMSISNNSNSSLSTTGIGETGAVAAEVRSATLERRELPQPAVREVRLVLPSSQPGFTDEVSYMRIYYVGSDTTAAVASALARGEQDGVLGYIFDLRNNPGGVFEEAVATAALYLSPGQAVATTIRNEEVVDARFVVGELSPEIFEVLPAPLRAAEPWEQQPATRLANLASSASSPSATGANANSSISSNVTGAAVVRTSVTLNTGGNAVTTPVVVRSASMPASQSNGGSAPAVADAAGEWRAVSSAGQETPTDTPDVSSSSSISNHGSGLLSKAPVMVLVNGNTASAAEVFAGALRDNHRASIIGTDTYGKGLVQWYFPLSGSQLMAEHRDGMTKPKAFSLPNRKGEETSGGLKITVAKYLTPSGYDISKNGGLRPDLFCSDHPRDWERLTNKRLTAFDTVSAASSSSSSSSILSEGNQLQTQQEKSTTLAVSSNGQRRVNNMQVGDGTGGVQVEGGSQQGVARVDVAGSRQVPMSRRHGHEYAVNNVGNAAAASTRDVDNMDSKVYSSGLTTNNEAQQANLAYSSESRPVSLAAARFFDIVSASDAQRAKQTFGSSGGMLTGTVAVASDTAAGNAISARPVQKGSKVPGLDACILDALERVRSSSQ